MTPVRAFCFYVGGADAGGGVEADVGHDYSLFHTVVRNLSLESG